MRGRFLLLLLLLSLTSMMTYAVAINVTTVNQLGGTGQETVPKFDFAVRSVTVPSGPTISSVTASVQVTQPGTYLVQARVTVGACTLSGSTTALLGTTPTTVTINFPGSCTRNAPTIVQVTVLQAP